MMVVAIGLLEKREGIRVYGCNVEEILLNRLCLMWPSCILYAQVVIENVLFWCHARPLPTSTNFGMNEIKTMSCES